MKITKTQLKKIIKEELENKVEEAASRAPKTLKIAFEELDNHLNPDVLPPYLQRVLGKMVNKISEKNSLMNDPDDLEEWESILSDWGFNYSVSGEMEDLANMDLETANRLRNAMAAALGQGEEK